jgi:methylenetetrahydrofolate reductase (NADPH)
VNKHKSGSNLERLLEQGEFVVTAELGPPKSIEIQLIDQKIKTLKGMVDAVNITDNQSSVVIFDRYRLLRHAKWFGTDHPDDLPGQKPSGASG